MKLPKLRVRSERGIQKGVYELCDERKWLNFNLQIIRQSRPRYQKIAAYMQPIKSLVSTRLFALGAVMLVGLDDFAILHHEHDLLHDSDIDKGVSLYSDDVGQLAGLEFRPIVNAQQIGRVNRRRL